MRIADESQSKHPSLNPEEILQTLREPGSAAQHRFIPRVAIRVSNALRIQARTTSPAPLLKRGGYARIRLNTQVTSLRSSEATSTREARAMHSSQAWGWRGTVPKASPRKGT